MYVLSPDERCYTRVFFCATAVAVGYTPRTRPIRGSRRAAGDRLLLFEKCNFKLCRRNLAVFIVFCTHLRESVYGGLLHALSLSDYIDI